MKAKIDKQLLENILMKLQNSLEKKDNSDITSHVYLNIDTQGAIFKATDHETGMIIKTNNITCNEAGGITANGKKFVEIVRILKEGEVDIFVNDNKLIIEQQNAHYELPMFDFTTFPEMPNTDEVQKLNFEGTLNIQELKRINPAVPTNNPSYQLNGALINIKKDGVDLVSTDTKRLAVINTNIKCDSEHQIIIPKRAITEISRLFIDNISMYFDDVNLIIQSEDTTFFTKVISGKFPDYQRIIPDSFTHEITLPKAKIIEVLRQVKIVNHEVLVKFDTSTITLTAINKSESSNANLVIDLETSLEDSVEIMLNSNFLIDFLTNINEEDFKIGLNGTEPFQVKSGNFFTIIVPINN